MSFEWCQIQKVLHHYCNRNHNWWKIGPRIGREHLAYSTRMSMVCKRDFPDPWRTILDLILIQYRERPDPKHLKPIEKYFKWQVKKVFWPFTVWINCCIDTYQTICKIDAEVFPKYFSYFSLFVLTCYDCFLNTNIFLSSHSFINRSV